MRKTTLTNPIYIEDVKYAILNKQNDLVDYEEQVEAGEYREYTTRVTQILQLNDDEYATIIENLLTSYSFVKQLDGGWLTDRVREGALIVKASTGEAFVVDTQGYDYCRYVGLVGRSLTEILEYR